MRLRVQDLGRLPYAHALAIQREVNRAVSQGPGDEGVLLLVEHDPVITVTHRQGAWDNLLAPQDKLDELGIDLQVTDRGGDITYHGPGQLVAYPILRLNPLGMNLSSYMRWLETLIIALLADFGITGERDEGATGVWVSIPDIGYRVSSIGKPGSAETRLAKICAMGVRVRKNTTMHGLALNVTTDLSHFTTIDPCGLGGRPVTSLNQLLGPDTPTMPTVKRALVDRMAEALHANVVRAED